MLASHLKNNVAKMPAETLLLNIGNGVFCLEEMENKNALIRCSQHRKEKV